MKKLKSNLLQNRKLKILGVFLGLSILFWFFSKLSKEYTHKIRFKTTYINISTTKILQKTPINYLDLTLKAQGFSLFSYNFKNPFLHVDLTNLQKLKNGLYYLETNRNFTELQTQLNTETTLIQIKPDTLFFDLGILKTKEVAVKSNLKLNFTPGFNLTEDVKITPKKIKITGPKRIIDSVLNVITKTIVLDDLQADFTKKIDLVTINKLKYSTKVITISGKIEKFTEGKIILDYKLINVPDNLIIDSFTKEITLTYNVSLNNFNKISAKDFSVICDFKQAQKDSLGYLVPKLNMRSSLVSNIKMTPNKITYLIKK